MAKTLDAINITFEDVILDQVTGLDLPLIRKRMEQAGADSALIWIDGEPVIIRDTGTTAR